MIEIIVFGANSLPPYRQAITHPQPFCDNFPLPPSLFELVNMRFPGGGIFSISIHISVNKQQRIEETLGQKVFEKMSKNTDLYES